MNDFKQGTCQLYIVDGEPTSNHQWNDYFKNFEVQETDAAEAANLNGPGVIIVHGHPCVMAQDIATGVTGKPIAVVVVSGAGAKAPESTDFALHPQLYYRASNVMNGSLGQCLMRFWKICNDSKWMLPYKFELVEPPQFWDLVDDLSNARRDPNAIMAEFRNRIELYRQAGLTNDTPLESSASRGSSLDEVRKAAMLFGERQKDIGELKWQFRINHNHLTKVMFFENIPWEVKAHLGTVCNEDKRYQYREAIALELEALRGEWQIYCEEFPDGRLFTGLKSFEKKVENLLCLLDELFASDTDGESVGKKVVEAARDLIAHLRNYIANEPSN